MIWKKSIATASPRLQRLLLRLATYETQVEYICGKDNLIADALSRVDPLSPKPMDSKQMDMIPVHHITLTVPATDNWLDRTRIATTADPALNQLRHYIFHGWPLQRHQLPEQLQHYWNYREELAVEDGVIFKAHRLVISPSLIAEYLKDLHAGHVGEEKTLLRARETVFWPGISDDVRNALKLCDVCMKYKPAQQKEPPVPHDVPSLPWFKLRVDIFYFNTFPLVKKLTSQTGGHVIRLLKTIFSEHGVPRIQNICPAVQIRSATLKPKVSSVEWFHWGHGQTRNRHNGEGRRVGFWSTFCNSDLSCDPNQTGSAQPRRDAFLAEI